MDSKTRVKTALNHEVPDKIPFGEFAIDFDTVEKILGHETYVRAKAKSQIAFWEGRRDEVVQSWKEDGVAEDEYLIRDGQDGVLWGQDYAYKTGPLISPEMFAEFVAPLTTKRVRDINTNFGLPVWQNACGNNWALLDMFVEMGFACYQSIQPTAEMDIREVKRQYGDKLCLWGGVPVEHLVDVTTEDIRKDVAYAVENARQDGGLHLREQPLDRGGDEIRQFHGDGG